jgi:hypothetical protein
MMRPAARIPGLLLLLLVLAGCGMLARPQADFAPAIENFTQRLRWLDLADAAQFLEPEYRSSFLEQFDALDGLRITEVRFQVRDQPGGSATVESQLEIDYYLLPSVTIKSRRLRLAWNYVGEDRWHPGSWQIVGPFPVFP